MNYFTQNIMSSINNLSGKIKGSGFKARQAKSFSILDQMKLIRDDCGDTLTKLQYFIAGFKSISAVIPGTFINPNYNLEFGFLDLVHLSQGDETAEFPMAICRHNNADYLCYAERSFDPQTHASTESIIPVRPIDWTTLPSDGVLSLYSLLYLLNADDINTNYSGSFMNWINGGNACYLNIPMDGKILHFKINFNVVIGDCEGVSTSAYAVGRIDSYRIANDDSDMAVPIFSPNTFWDNSDAEQGCTQNRETCWRTLDIPFYMKPSVTGKPYTMDLISLINDIQDRAILQDTLYSLTTEFCNGNFTSSGSLRQQVMNIIQIKGYDDVGSVKDFLLQINASSDSITGLSQILGMFYTDMSECTVDQNNPGQYTFNSEYVTTRDLQTTITNAISSVASTVLAGILTAINPILGAIAYGIGNAVNSIIEAKNQIIDSITYPTVNFDSILNNFDMPFFQRTELLRTQDLPDDLRDVGSAVTMKLPGSILLIWVSGKGSIDGQVYVSYEAYVDLYQIVADSNHMVNGNYVSYGYWKLSQPGLVLLDSSMTCQQFVDYYNEWKNIDFTEDRPWREAINAIATSLTLTNDNKHLFISLHYLIREAVLSLAFLSYPTNIVESASGSTLSSVLPGYSSTSPYAYWNRVNIITNAWSMETVGDTFDWVTLCSTIHMILQASNGEYEVSYLHAWPLIMTDFLSYYAQLFPDSSETGTYMLKYSEGRPSQIVDLLIPPTQSISSSTKRKLLTGLVCAGAIAAGVAVAGFCIRRAVRQKSTYLAAKSLKARNDLASIDPNNKAEWDKAYKNYRSSIFRYSLFSSLTGSNGLAVSGSVNPNWSFQSLGSSSGLLESTARIFSSTADITESTKTIKENTQSIFNQTDSIDTKTDSIDNDTQLIIDLIRGPQ